MSIVTAFARRQLDGAGSLLPLAGPADGQPAASGHELAWAVTQDRQAALQWRHWGGTLPDSIRVGELKQDGLIIGGDGDDCATLDAPCVEFDTRQDGTARLVIRLTGGTMRFRSGSGRFGPVVRQSLVGWKLGFLVRLRIDQIGLADLLDPALPIAPALRASLAGLDIGAGRVQRVVLDLPNSDMVHVDPYSANLPSANVELKKKVAALVGAWLTEHAAGADPCLLGVPFGERRAHEFNRPALAYLTRDVTFDAERNRLSTSNFCW
jgi:hypothetical protein